MQDSLGSYLATDDGVVMNYRQFCERIISGTDAVWFNRLIDFYRDIHLKLDDHVENIEDSLEALIKFLNTSLQIEVTQFRITENSLSKLRDHGLSEEILKQLEPLKDQSYMNEIDFVAELVECLGQDIADEWFNQELCTENKYKDY